MKQYISIISIIGILVVANIFVYLFNLNPTLTLGILGACAGFYKVFICEEFSDIFNIHSFKYSLNNNNKLELIAAFLAGLISCKDIYDFTILDFFIFIIFSLMAYRFLFYNLSKKIPIKKV